MWTEIVTEDIGVLHLRGNMVLFPLSNDVSTIEAQRVKEKLVGREVIQREMERMRDWREQMKEREQARERLREAGYSDDEIPL